ncbi:protocadherin gamma-B5 isoform X13 [Xenopus tropicalis]|uniref:Protocadherin gamma-B5 isoform X13 n=1 Tax=Xenopus tropicalis TaxID=8364 RepID=A0A8J1J9T0_XENTR|nr:protocadherin gamma-B5 isoform X13 [Xenopus tropicalis]
MFLQRLAAMKIQQAQTYNGIKWQVVFAIFFSCLCQSVCGQLQYSIFEEMQKSSSVGNLANDLGLNIKEIAVRKLRIISRFSEKYFSVNLENGNLYVAERIDREALCGTAEDCFLTFDAVIENPLNVFHVRIDIKDINDNPPRFAHEIIELEMSEYTLPGALFALEKAEDLDVGTNSLKNYKLSANKHFVLSESTSTDSNTIPELVLETPLDRETENIHELVLTAFDGGNPVQTGTALIRITVTDFNDNLPVFSQAVYKVSINENIPINSTILYVSANDKDEGINSQIRYYFSTSSKQILNTFIINSISGAIMTKENLDFEKTKQYEISVQAKDGGGLVSHAKVLIQTLDENDNAPEISVTSITTPVSEDSPSGTVVALIEAHDLDSGENGEVDCQIIGTVPFKLSSSSGNFYKIVTTSTLDREKSPHYSITILATDKGSPPLTFRKTITLDVSDINDNPPVFKYPNYLAYIPENNQPGASIYSIQAIDNDSEENAKLIYSIINMNTGEPSPSSYISINPVTGVIYAQRSFDYEQDREFQIQIMAKDNGSPPLNSSVIVTICVTDQNDNSPLVLYPSADAGGSAAYEMVPFSSEQGTLVTKVVAVDADSGHNAWLSYDFLQDSETSYFVIDQYTGEIRTSRVFQERDILRHKVVVIVKDNGTPSLSATVTLTLVVADSFQHVIPEISNQPMKSDSQSNMQLYLVIAIALISFLFMLSVMIAIISKYRESKSPASFCSLSTYPQTDHRFLSQFNNGTLPLPYSYDVCVTLDSSERDFAFLKPHPNVPVESLIDADDSGIGNEKDIAPAAGIVQQAQPNADWRVSQAQRPGPSGAQPTEESGVWPNNQFETERLQAMILASANEAAEGSAIGGGTGTMGLSARYGPQFTLQHLPDYRQNIYIPGTTSTLTNAAGKGKSAAPSGGNKKKSGKKDKK